MEVLISKPLCTNEFSQDVESSGDDEPQEIESKLGNEAESRF